MMAVYNGICIYGTPQEIAEFVKTMEIKFTTTIAPTKITSGTITGSGTNFTGSFINHNEAVATLAECTANIGEEIGEQLKQLVDEVKRRGSSL